MDKNQIYDEENQIEDLNVEADRVIAMNPSGIIENFNNKKYECNGDSCVILDDNDDSIECVNGVCSIKKNNSYTQYIIYTVIFLALCALLYYFYKKYTKCDS